MIDQRKFGAILGYVYTILQTVIGILYIPILLTGIGKSEYGLYQVVGSIIAYFAAMEAPLCASILKYYTEYKERNDSVKMENTLAIGKRLFLVISLFFIIISIPILFVVRFSFEDTFTDSELLEISVMFVVMVLNLVVTMNNYVIVAAITACERFIFLKLSSLITLIFQPLLVVLIIQEYKFAFVIVIVQVSLNILMALWRTYYAKSKLKVKIVYHGFDKRLFKGMMTLSLATFGVALADQIFWRSDQLILGSMFGPDIVTEYSIGAQINALFIGIACVLGGVMMPTVTRKIVNGTDKDVSLFFAKTGRFQSFLIVPILFGFISFGQELINIITIGGGYDLSYQCALLLMIPYSIDLIQICGSTIMQVKNQFGYRAKLMFISAILNIGLTIVLAKHIGPIGAAISTTITIVISNGFILNYIYAKKMHLDLQYFFKSISLIWFSGIIVFPFGYIISFIEISSPIIQFVIHIFLYCIIFCLVLYFIALTRNERGWIHSVFIRFFLKMKSR